MDIDKEYNTKIRRLFGEAVDRMTIMVMKRVPPEMFMPFDELHRIVFAGKVILFIKMFNKG